MLPILIEQSEIPNDKQIASILTAIDTVYPFLSVENAGKYQLFCKSYRFSLYVDKPINCLFKRLRLVVAKMGLISGQCNYRSSQYKFPKRILKNQSQKKVLKKKSFCFAFFVVTISISCLNCQKRFLLRQKLDFDLVILPPA